MASCVRVIQLVNISRSYTNYIVYTLWHILSACVYALFFFSRPAVCIIVYALRIYAQSWLYTHTHIHTLHNTMWGIYAQVYSMPIIYVHIHRAPTPSAVIIIITVLVSLAQQITARKTSRIRSTSLSALLFLALSFAARPTMRACLMCGKRHRRCRKHGRRIVDATFCVCIFGCRVRTSMFVMD